MINKKRKKVIFKVEQLGLTKEVWKLKKENYSASKTRRFFKEQGKNISVNDIRAFLKAKPIKIKIGQYNTEKKKDCPHKYFINQMIVRMSVNMMICQGKQTSEAKIVLLDDTDFKTTDWYLRRNFKSKNIYIPNNDESKAKKMIKANKVNVFSMSYKQFIKNADGRYDVHYTDYCDTTKGKEEELSMIFDRNLHKDMFLLAMTFSYRQPKHYKYEDLDKIKDLIIEKSIEKGMIATQVFFYTYIPMSFIAYIITTPKKYHLIKKILPKPYKYLTTKIVENK